MLFWRRRNCNFRVKRGGLDPATTKQHSNQAPLLDRHFLTALGWILLQGFLLNVKEKTTLHSDEVTPEKRKLV